MIQVENSDKESVGMIEKADLPGCEKRSAMSFTTYTGSKIQMGIKKRTVKNFLVATYLIESEEGSYVLKDKPGNSLLYFCVVGKMNDQDIRIEENWNNEIEVKIDKNHVATIKTNEFTFKTTIFMEDTVSELSVLFAVIILMYFMYKVYKNETDVIENILFD